MDRRRFLKMIGVSGAVVLAGQHLLPEPEPTLRPKTGERYIISADASPHFWRDVKCDKTYLCMFDGEEWCAVELH